jgi:hypothetical protein
LIISDRNASDTPCRRSGGYNRESIDNKPAVYDKFEAGSEESLVVSVGQGVEYLRREILSIFSLLCASIYQ